MDKQIGGYKVIRLIGKGGMSEVYEVENIRLGSRHALKLFTYEKNEAEVKERFMTEGRLLARLNHPRIVKVIDFGTDDESGRPYFVMDMILSQQGELKSLAEVDPGTVDEEQIGVWYDDIREGLNYIHANGVIHRDLKLQNILIGPDEHAVITDFGISKVFDVKGDGVQIVDTVRTIVKMREGRNLVMGSLGYMAPELEMGVAASPQSDWYALGVIVYRLLTGTWCDARTDVIENLETYKAVWKRIIPKLLHSNPNGRECLSYAEEDKKDREYEELEAENRWLKEKQRGHLARHLARWVTGVAVLLMVAIGYVLIRHDMERKLWKAESRFLEGSRLLFSFDDIFKIPADAKTDAQINDNGDLIVPAREDLATAQIDLLVITHETFVNLGTGKITIERAIADLERLQRGIEETGEAVMGPNGYVYGAQDDVLCWLLERGLEKMRELQNDE